MQLTIAGLQAAGARGDVAANLAAIEQAATAARDRGADLLITPEMFVTGYNLPPERMDALATLDLPHRVAELARRTGIAILAGLPVRAGAGVANAALLVDAGGAELARYRKTHLFGELDRALFVAGDRRPPVVELGGVRVTPMICYDVEFPEVVRTAVLDGADAVLVPTAQMEPYAFVAEHLVRTRAWENQVYVAYINRTGAEGDLRYVGRTSIVAPSAEVLDTRSSDDEGLVVATLDTDVVRRARTANPYLTDLRTDLP